MSQGIRTVTFHDRLGRPSTFRAETILGVTAEIRPADDYFGATIATYAIVHFTGGTSIRVAESAAEVMRAVATELLAPAAEGATDVA